MTEKARSARRFSLLVAGSCLAGAALLVSPAIGADCRQQISYRLWQESGERFFAFGDELTLEPGEQFHLYIAAAGQGEKLLGTTATIGYPGEFGFGGTIRAVMAHVRMEAQDAADRQSGRIRFTTAEPGGTSLGYRIAAVEPPGQLAKVDPACRVGQVLVRVLPKPPPTLPAVEPQAIAPREAAEQLVVLLYYGLLRRRIVDQFDQGFVETVQKKGRAGLEQIAEHLLESNEFRESAVRRAEERHGPPKRGGKPLTELLLGDIYAALYGSARPPQKEVKRDLEDLDVCLKGKSWHIETCGRLGRSLVASPLFQERNKDLIGALVSGQGGG